MERMNPRILTLAALASLGCLGGAAPAFAQAYYYPSYSGDRPVQWFIDGGGSITTGQTNTYFNNGGTLGGGVLIKPDPQGPFALRVDFDLGYHSATDAFLAASGSPGTSGYMDTFTGFLDGVLRAPVSAHTRLYAMGGVGVGYRDIYLGQGGIYCNDFWGYCGPGYGYVSTDNSTNFAWNAGVGVDFLLPYGQAWFIEARYERIETSGAPTEFIPIRFGWRF